MIRHSTIKLILVLLILFVVWAPAQNAQNSIQRATRVRVEKTEGLYGPLFITVDGKEKKITDQAQQAWIVNGGWQVAYSSGDGAGGFENEGQSLHLYDVRSGTHKRVMSEYFMIDKVEEAVTSRKKRALLVTMSDGGLGASYVAVVDPSRGEVFFRRHARILARRSDIIVIGFYKEADWDKLNDMPPRKVRPYKSEQHNLNSLLRRRVIVNQKSPST